MTLCYLTDIDLYQKIHYAIWCLLGYICSCFLHTLDRLVRGYTLSRFCTLPRKSLRFLVREQKLVYSIPLVWFVWLNLYSFCHGWQTFSGVRVAQSLVVCVMVGRLLVGFVCLNLQFYVSWLVDFYTTIQFSGRFLVGFVWLNLVFCVMVGRFLVGFVWLNLQFSVLWLVDFLWASCGSIFSLLCDVRQTISGVRVAIYIAQSFVFLCHGRQTFSGVRVAQSLVFCVMVGRLLVGFVWLNLQFSASWLGDLQWSSCGSISTFLSHGWQTFSGVRVAQYLDFCVMIGRLLVRFVWLNL